MAYVFDRVMNALNQGTQKANLFGASASDKNMDKNRVVRDTGAGGGGGGGGSIPGGGESSMGGGGEAANDSASYSRIAESGGPSANPYEGILKQQGQAGKSLQDEANSYMAGAEGQRVGIKDSTLKNAIGGRKSSVAAVQRFNAQGAPLPYDSFNPNTDVNVGDDAYLGSEGYGNYLAGQAGNQYSMGERNLDLALSGRDTGLQMARENARRGKDELANTKDTLAQTQTQKAQDVTANKFQEAKKSLTDRLTAEQQKILDVAEGKAKEAMAAAKGNPTAEAVAEENWSQIKNALLAKNTNSNERTRELSNVMSRVSQDYDPMKYVTAGKSDFKGSDFIDKGAAKTLNRISDLGGFGSNYAGGGGAGPGTQFDSSKLSKEFGGAYQSAVTANDAKIQGEIDKILAANRKDSDYYNSGRDQQRAVGVSQDRITKWAQENGVNLEGLDYNDIEEYIKMSDEGQFGDFIDEEEAAQLNALNQRAGKTPSYKAGAGRSDPWTFDLEGYGTQLKSRQKGSSAFNDPTSPTNEEMPIVIPATEDRGAYRQLPPQGSAPIDQKTGDNENSIIGKQLSQEQQEALESKGQYGAKGLDKPVLSGLDGQNDGLNQTTFDQRALDRLKALERPGGMGGPTNFPKIFDYFL